MDHLISVEKEPNMLKDTSKGFLKFCTWGSVFDPEMSPEKIEQTREFTTKEAANHLTGKEKLYEKYISVKKGCNIHAVI